MSTAILSSDLVTIKPTSKEVKLEKDDRGYYRVVLGAFNAPSKKGHYYAFTKHLENMFSNPNSELMQRIVNRRLYGEFGHPSLSPGESLTSFINRFRSIDERNISHHIREINLKEMRDAKGNQVVAIYAWVRPHGKWAQTLEIALSNPEENFAFSIRSASDRYDRNGRLEKEIHTIFTWDGVNNPGIEEACTYNGLTAESYTEHEFSEGDLAAAEEVANYLCSQLGVESESNVTFTMIRDNAGWKAVETTNLSIMDWR